MNRARSRIVSNDPWLQWHRTVPTYSISLSSTTLRRNPLEAFHMRTVSCATNEENFVVLSLQLPTQHLARSTMDLPCKSAHLHNVPLASTNLLNAT